MKTKKMRSTLMSYDRACSRMRVTKKKKARRRAGRMKLMLTACSLNLSLAHTTRVVLITRDSKIQLHSVFRNRRVLAFLQTVVRLNSQPFPTYSAKINRTWRGNPLQSPRTVLMAEIFRDMAKRTFLYHSTTRVQPFWMLERKLLPCVTITSTCQIIIVKLAVTTMATKLKSRWILKSPKTRLPAVTHLVQSTWSTQARCQCCRLTSHNSL